MKRLVKLSAETHWFKCPGCREPHQIYTSGPKAWAWNGSVEKPTFSPSILVRESLEGVFVIICHSYVEQGKIRFLPDSTHALSGQTVDLPEVNCEQDLFYKPEEMQ